MTVTATALVRKDYIILHTTIQLFAFNPKLIARTDFRHGSGFQVREDLIQMSGNLEVTLSPSKSEKPTMGRSSEARSYRKAEPRGVAALKYSRREVWCGRVTVSRFWANIAERSWAAPSLPVTRMDRFALRHPQPRRFSPPTPHASFSVLSFTRSGR